MADSTPDTTAEEPAPSLEAQDEVVDDEAQDDDASLYQTTPSTLPYFGADFDVAGLVRRLDDEDILIPRFDPDESGGLTIDGFQRQRVWSGPRMDKFIESLLLGWPVPSVFLVVEPDGRYLVLDGQQRLTTLQSFYRGTRPDGKPFLLSGVAEHLDGVGYSSLAADSKRRLNNTFIQAVVIEPKGDEGRDAVYRLFGRLNSGGVQLTPQEIRVALYRGPLVDFIRDLNHIEPWRSLFGPPNKNLKDHELILRALAMARVVDGIAEHWDNSELRKQVYVPPMAQFLNKYLKADAASEPGYLAAAREAFEQTCAELLAVAGRDSIRIARRLNAAHIDAVLGVMIYSKMRGQNIDADRLASALQALRGDATYVEWISRSTSHRDSVYGRLQKAYQALIG